MSTCYITDQEIKWADFWNNIPPSLREEIVPDSTDIKRCLTDDISFLWCYTDNAETGVISFTRWGSQSTTSEILSAIEKHFDVEIISEHDDRFYEE